MKRSSHAGVEKARRKVVRRLYLAAHSDQPGSVHRASSAIARHACCLCGERIETGQGYCVAHPYRAHYDCVPGLGVDAEDWMLEDLT